MTTPSSHSSKDILSKAADIPPPPPPPPPPHHGAHFQLGFRYVVRGSQWVPEGALAEGSGTRSGSRPDAVSH